MDYISPDTFSPDRYTIDGRYRRPLVVAIKAALQAGELLREEFYRPGGPVRTRTKCDADTASEQIIRKRLRIEFPDYGQVGEECAELDQPSSDGEYHVWQIDPNDGTSAFMRGWRGASVSIGLLRDGIPVLGVVYAYAAQAGAGDLIAWAEGQPLTRGGKVLLDAEKTDLVIGGEPIDDSPLEDAPLVVMTSQGADSASAFNGEVCRPCGYRAVPGIAYRLALVAVGEGVGAISVSGPVEWDVAAGHALLRAVGGQLRRLGGEEITYDRQGRGEVGACIAGRVDFVEKYSARNWRGFLTAQRTKPLPIDLLKPDPKRLVSDIQRLDRAQGCMIGQIAGDNLGALVEFETAEAIAEKYPDGPRELTDGGVWNILAGQPTDDSELALLLARTIVAARRYIPESAARAYAWWYGSRPFDIGGTTSAALNPAWETLRTSRDDTILFTPDKCDTQPEEVVAQAAREAASESSQANGALMRIAPLGIYGHRLTDEQLADFARQDARLTHPNRVCQDASAIFCVAVAAAIRGEESPADIYRHSLDWGRSAELEPTVLSAVEAAEHSPPEDFQHKMGWVRIALQNAFYRLLHSANPVDGLAQTVAAGGDTDTNAAIAGALLGAHHGAAAFPRSWIGSLLSARPMADDLVTSRPRPRPLWPVDCLLLAELLIAD